MDATLVAFSGPVMGASAVFADEPRSIGRDEDHCAAIAEFLIEIEMFGHQRSAFTGAIAQKRGKIEAADSGTLFLDEMCELDPPLQAKLLRVARLQGHELLPLSRAAYHPGPPLCPCGQPAWPIGLGALPRLSAGPPAPEDVA